jgi:hypothetical protein
LRPETAFVAESLTDHPRRGARGTYGRIRWRPGRTSSPGTPGKSLTSSATTNGPGHRPGFPHLSRPLRHQGAHATTTEVANTILDRGRVWRSPTALRGQLPPARAGAGAGDCPSGLVRLLVRTGPPRLSTYRHQSAPSHRVRVARSEVVSSEDEGRPEARATFTYSVEFVTDSYNPELHRSRGGRRCLHWSPG